MNTNKKSGILFLHTSSFLISFMMIIFLPISIWAIGDSSYISTTGGTEMFTLSESGKSTTLCIDSEDFQGVIRALHDLKTDIGKVTQSEPTVVFDELPSGEELVIVGTYGKSRVIEQLAESGKLNVEAIAGKWETFSIQTIINPFPGIERALVIVGSDKRGTIYGIYDVSEQIGVSPWYWWADAPVQKKDNIYVIPGTYSDGEPAVKYRGIFINDESPAFRNWATEKFGGLNHKCYEKVFELLLRNKANYLWPAMWIPTMFNEDDSLNPKVADEYGIVMSTSHHEPMMRAHNEWYRYNGGAWNYETNKEKLQEFWRGGIERMGDYESVVTVGMRGDGDEAMSEETAVDLLKHIISDQRQIIADVTGKPAHETPQMWAVYKEVQDYYDKGMRVDDDIIILFCDDNWGNLRILPKTEDLNHKAGYGIYYHFDYVGAPLSYRWLNTIQIERVWEQMNLAYEHGVEDLWLVNVGDIKPMELPISFFLDYAWNPDAIQANDLPNYYVSWAKQQFGDYHTEEIAELLSLYAKYNARRTPEMLTPDTYSHENYREADRVVDEFYQLLGESSNIYNQLPESHKSAFYQLVHSPIEMCCNLNEMYVAAGKNKLYGEQGRASANYYAEKVKELFYKDAELARQFHEELENGKWNHMMSQTHIGYTSWNHPRANKMPAVSFIQSDTAARLGFMVEHGPSPSWGGFSVEGNPLFSPGFMEFDPINQQSYYLEIFNMGEKTLDYSIEAKNEWIQLSKTKGSIQYHEKVYVSIDWAKAPKGKTTGSIVIKGTGKEYVIIVPVHNDLPEASGFIENNDVVSFEAANYTGKFDSENIHWTIVPNLGRTNSSLIVEPVNASRHIPDNNSPRVEYEFTIFDAGELAVEAYLSPTQDFKKQDGLKYAISVDDEEPQIINLNEGESKPDWEYAEWWTKSVGDHIKIKRSEHGSVEPGKHTLKVWMIDPGIVFQKFVIDAGGLKPSYLGPPESLYVEY